MANWMPTGKSKLVSSQRGNMDAQRCTAVYWYKQAAGIGMKLIAGHSDPREVRTKPETRRVESGSAMIGSVVKVRRAMRGSTGPPGTRSPETKLCLSFGNNVFL